jgi:hypothetical protein
MMALITALFAISRSDTKRGEKKEGLRATLA